MVKKARKRENKKLAVQQAIKIQKRVQKNRDVHNIPKPTAGQSFSHIKNKHKRSQMVSLMKTEQKRPRRRSGGPRRRPRPGVRISSARSPGPSKK